MVRLIISNHGCGLGFNHKTFNHKVKRYLMLESVSSKRVWLFTIEKIYHPATHPNTSFIVPRKISQAYN
jgi:hypothetical protein